MNLAQVDLNLLVALDALLRERNVTRAGRQIGLSQPAMSAALARLRDLFGDVGSAGGHKDAARAEIPLQKINCGSDRDADCRRFIVQRIKSGSLGG